MRLLGKVAVVTGGARGIGRAIAERYAEEGARVVVADLSATESKALAEQIGRGAIGLALDVTKQDSIDAMVAAVVQQAGRIDVLVNNAGVFDMAPLLDITRDSYRRVFAVNVEGLLFTLQAVARQMVQQGQGGKIVNFASQAGRPGGPLRPHGPAGGHDRHGGVPRQQRCRLHRRADLQCRWRQLDELNWRPTRFDAAATGRQAAPASLRCRRISDSRTSSIAARSNCVITA